MKNKYSFTAPIALLIFAFSFGCQQAANSNANASSNVKLTESTPMIQEQQKAEVTTSDANKEDKLEADSVGSLGSPTEAYVTAYKLRASGDIDGLKNVCSKDTLEFLTDIGKADNKSLDQMLKDLAATPQYKTSETRNEKISDGRATLEYRNKDGKWETMDFEKEDGGWKLALPKFDEAPKK